MFNKIFTIRKIKKLRSDNVNGRFLADFRSELADYVRKNPITQKDNNLAGINQFIYFNKLNFKSMPVIIIALLALITTGGGVAAASQSSLPNEALYPVKMLTEEVREAISFNSDAKAKLHAEYAAERVEEVQEMLNEKGIDAKGLDIALANLKEHASQTASIIEEQRGKGKDVSALAKEMQNKIEKAKNDLENKMIEAGVKARNDAEKKILKERVEKAKGEMEENEDRIGKSEEFKIEAEAAIMAAQKQLTEAMQKGLATSTDLIKYNTFMDKASTSISKEHWVQARQLARQAEKTLEKIENKIEKAIQKEDNKNSQSDENVQRANRKEVDKKGNGRNNATSSVENDDTVATTTINQQ